MDLLYFDTVINPLVQAGAKIQDTTPSLIAVEGIRTGDHIKTFFGTAEVISVIRYWRNCKICNLRDISKEQWARNEGFANFAQADEWFTLKYGKNWQEKEYRAIKFDGDWIQEA